ncbi:MAG: transglycosylase SLT domain-containing protein [Pseudomonadota bacterium]
MATGSTVSAASQNIVAAISSASRRTGADFSYLVDTAMRESSFNPGAQAKTSSAAGLFQFIEQTWLQALKTHGPALGFEKEAGAIAEDRSTGRLAVGDKSAEDAILSLRFDPKASALIAGAMAVESRETLETRLGRPLREGELYASHFLGVNGAATLIEAAAREPKSPAAELFPKAARANASVFYDDAGRPRTNEALLQKLTARPNAAPALDRMGNDVSEGEGDARSPIGLYGATRRTSAGQRGALVLSPLAMSTLQSLDPTRLRAQSDKQDRS